MAYILTIFLALISLSILAIPILKRKKTNITEFHGSNLVISDLDTAQARLREGVKSAILDYELGNISDEEYVQQIREYRLESARSLMDQAKMDSSIEKFNLEVESEVMTLRVLWGAVNDTMPCESCSVSLDQRSSFCPNCEFVVESNKSSMREESREESSPQA